MSQLKYYIAFYKRKRPVNSLSDLGKRIMDDITKLVTRGKYSHCELAILNEEDTDIFDCYSSSVRDGGVRNKLIQINPEHWDLIEIDISEERIQTFYTQTKGMKYDFIGALGLVFKFRDNPNKYFCSEWCAEAIGLKNPRAYSPVKLHKNLYEKQNIKLYMRDDKHLRL